MVVLIALGTIGIVTHFSSIFLLLRPDISYQPLASLLPSCESQGQSFLQFSRATIIYAYSAILMSIIHFLVSWGRVCMWVHTARCQVHFNSVCVRDTAINFLSELSIYDFIYDSHLAGMGFQHPKNYYCYIT